MLDRRAVVATLLALALVASARAEDEWKLTGSAIRVKSVAFVDVNVYEIESRVKEFPKTKSKRAMIDLEVDKKLVWTMKRDVAAEKIRTALEDGFELNDYKDKDKIKAITKAFTEELKEKSHVTIVYDAAKKETTVTVESGKGTATVAGVEFMKAVWSLWFGKIDQETLGDELIQKIP